MWVLEMYNEELKIWTPIEKGISKILLEQRKTFWGGPNNLKYKVREIETQAEWNALVNVRRTADVMRSYLSPRQAN
jgi:hypothetical protein